MTASADSSASDAWLPSPWIHAFAGTCLACVGLAFFFIDRQYGDIGVATLPWLIATALGFGTGAVMLNRGGAGGRAMCAVLGIVGLALAVFPTFMMYSLVRWISLCLLFVGIARAPLLRTRRDLYFALMTCFVAASVVAIHPRADWLLWTYLGPACLFAGLALTMEHAGTHAVSLVTKLTSSALFVCTVIVLSSLMFFWLPRPPVLGFGFLPPPVAHIGTAPKSAGGNADAKGGGVAEPGPPGMAQSAATDADSAWEKMVERMRSDLLDPEIPGWQRAVLAGLLDALGSLYANPSGSREPQAQAELPSTGEAFLSSSVRIVVVRIKFVTLLTWLALLVLTAFCWAQRRVLAFTALSAASYGLSGVHPLGSMKLSARMMAVGLSRIGIPDSGARTLREQLAKAHELPLLARRWYGEALDLYHASRFGRMAATPASARSMRLAVQDATDLALAARRDRSRSRIATAAGEPN